MDLLDHMGRRVLEGRIHHTVLEGRIPHMDLVGLVDLEDRTALGSHIHHMGLVDLEDHTALGGRIYHRDLVVLEVRTVLGGRTEGDMVVDSKKRSNSRMTDYYHNTDLGIDGDSIDIGKLLLRIQKESSL